MRIYIERSNAVPCPEDQTDRVPVRGGDEEKTGVAKNNPVVCEKEWLIIFFGV